MICILLIIILHCSISCFLGYAIIQLPELLTRIFDIVRKRVLRENAVRPSKDNDNVHGLKSSDFNAVPTFTTITRAKEYNTDAQFVKLMAIMDQKIDQKIHQARQEILDLIGNRFDVLQSK